MCMAKRKENKFLREWTTFELRIQRTYSEWLMIADDCESNATNIQSAFLLVANEWASRSGERTEERHKCVCERERERKSGRNIDTVSTNTPVQSSTTVPVRMTVLTHTRQTLSIISVKSSRADSFTRCLSLQTETFRRCFTSHSIGMHSSRRRHTVFFSLLLFLLLRSFRASRLFCFRMRCTFECVISIVLLCMPLLPPLLLLLSFVPEPWLCTRFSHSGFRVSHTACPTSQCWFIDVRCLTNFNSK